MRKTQCFCCSRRCWIPHSPSLRSIHPGMSCFAIPVLWNISPHLCRYHYQSLLHIIKNRRAQVRWDLLSLRLLTGVKYSPVLTEPHLSFSSVPMAGVNLPSASGIWQGFNTLLTLRDLPFWAPQHRFFYACQINIFPDDKYCLTSSFPVKGLENNSSSSYTIHPASSQIQNRLISLCSSKFMLFLSLCCASHRFSQLLWRDSDLQFITSNTH